MKKITFKINDIIEVDWTDVCTNHGWHRSDYKITPYRCKVIGYFRGIEHKGLVLTSGHSTDREDPDTLDVWHIPLGCIDKMRKVKT